MSALEYPPDRGGIIADPALWYSSPGFEFWIVFGHVDLMTVQAATNRGLSGAGWTGAIAATASITEGAGADFLSSADLDPTRLVRGSTNLAMRSPRVFGSYDHGQAAARFLGHTPTRLTLEFYGRMSVASANENTSGWGFHTPAGTDFTAAGSAGGIVSDGTNFRLRSVTGNDAGAAIDTAWHLWRIEWIGTTVEWFIDNTSQGTVTLDNDIWPTSLAFLDGTTNRPQTAWARVFYS